MEDKIAKILAENARRKEVLNAVYDPMTGEGLDDDRVRLALPDCSLPVQYIPRKMLANELIDKLIAAGSIAAFIAKYGQTLSPKEVEDEIFKIRYRHDFPFWAYMCFPIKQKMGGYGRFILNYPQLKLNKIIQERQDKGEPLDVIIVKARQWGGSTYSIAKQAHIMLTLDKYHSFAVAAQVQSAANNIIRMLRHVIRRYPATALGLPKGTQLKLGYVQGMRTVYGILDSRGNQVIPATIYIGSIQNPDSLRSQDIRGAHYSEVGVWDNTPEHRPEDLIASISGSIANLPYSMQVMESTAKSSDDFFHEVYANAKHGQSNYRPIFIPWFNIPHDTRHINEGEKEFARWLLQNKDKSDTDGKWLDSGKHYWWLWNLGATLQGINWYRYNRLNYTKYSQMANEAPSTDTEAFQSAGEHVFDIYKIEEMRATTCPPRKIGNLYNCNMHGEFLRSDNVRDETVLQNIQFYECSNGNLKIWEMPEYKNISNRYVVAVDIGGPNPTSDYHSARVFDRALMMKGFDGRPGIVAEMHYHCLRDTLAYDVMRLAKWYNDALLVIESNTYEMSNKERNVGGDGSQYILDIIGSLYPNLYARQSSPEEILQGKPRKWGFRTDARTKPMIIDLMQWAVSTHAWTERCSYCLDELSIYVSKNNKFDAPPGKHDDELMATAIGLWICYKELPLPELIPETHHIPIRNNTLADF